MSRKIHTSSQLSNLNSSSFVDMDKSQSLSGSHQNDLEESLVKAFEPIRNLPEPQTLQQSCK